MGAPNEEGDTLICKFGDAHREELKEVFEECEGYLGHRFNDQIRAVFVKFSSCELAGVALDSARGIGLDVDVAKRSLSL